ncbi:hypothetical protein EMMF5_004244 [Cystobasidiomycetes sp. EMM_F5]
MNLVAVCMMFTDEHSKKVQKKSDQLLAEVKQVALDYQSKVEQALNKQETEMSAILLAECARVSLNINLLSRSRATYEAYYKADLADKQERLEIIQQLNDNYAKIEVSYSATRISVSNIESF